MSAIADAWRKNAPELAGLWNGAIPRFVVSPWPDAAPGGVPVFSYHLIEPEVFGADLEFLRVNGYQTLSSSEFLGFLAGTQRVNDRAVLLTFDDGAENFHRIAWPLLKQYGARAMAFIAPGLHVEVEDEQVPDRPMSWPQLRELVASGLVEVQSHTFESCYAPEWPLAVSLAGYDPRLEDARRSAVPQSFPADLEHSKRLIEARLPGVRVDQLAFPRYQGTAAAVQAARSLGFRACYWGLTPGRGINRRGDSPFHVSRINDEFLRRLPGTGRITLSAMAAERLRRIRAARQRRASHPAPERV